MARSNVENLGLLSESGFGPNGRNGGRGGRGINKHCYQCGRPGHLERDCTRNKGYQRTLSAHVDCLSSWFDSIDKLIKAFRSNPEIVERLRAMRSHMQQVGVLIAEQVSQEAGESILAAGGVISAGAGAGAGIASADQGQETAHFDGSVRESSSLEEDK